ncbi:MAG TPA: hypothetical protein VGF39_10040, partial [Stellaceae bacterium]
MPRFEKDAAILCQLEVHVRSWFEAVAVAQSLADRHLPFGVIFVVPGGITYAYRRIMDGRGRITFRGLETSAGRLRKAGAISVWLGVAALSTIEAVLCHRCAVELGGRHFFHSPAIPLPAAKNSAD